MPELLTASTEQESTVAVMAVVNALETMAFISPLPAENSQDLPGCANPVHVSIGFTGPARGRLELLADPAIGRAMASNLLGLEPTDPSIDARGRDALKELVNVACGLFLDSLRAEKASCECSRFQMMLPELVEADGAARDRFLNGRSTLLDADGRLLAVRITME